MGAGTEALVFMTTPKALLSWTLPGITLISDSSNSAYNTNAACQAYAASTPGCVAL